MQLLSNRARGSSTDRPPAPANERAVSLVDFGASRLEALCRAGGFGSETEAAVATFRDLVAPWGDAPLDQPRAWLSEISDDNTPIELSAAIAGGRVEARVLWEAQASEPTLRAYREAALELTERLARDHGASLERFRRVQDLFVPEEMEGPFAIWHSVVFTPGAPPSFKAYLNPRARGAARAQALVEEGLCRLGLDRAWASLSRTTRRGPHLDELKYFALDLNDDSKSRVKVYVRHHGATASDLEEACSVSESHVAGEVHEFVRAMGGDRERLAERATFTCSAFVEGGARPTATTVYVPVCAYATDDREVRTRVRDYLVEHGGDPTIYEALIDGYTNRPLEAGVGMHSWVAFRRRGDDEPRLTVYLATEAAKVYARGSVPAATGDRMAFESAEAVIRCVGSYGLDQHPFVQRLLREPESAAGTWHLIRNTYEGTSKHFVRWLAWVTARVDDDRMRSLLARQLDQELGEGDLSKAHSHLMARFLDALDPLRPAGFDDARLESGRVLGRALAAHYTSEDGLEGVAALMAGEICAHHLIGAVARLLQRVPHSFDPAAIEWLTQHDELEGGHADESLVLARYVPETPEAIASIRRGALGTFEALWRSLDELYVDHFGGETG